MESRIRLECEREVAVFSPDHMMPWGTRKNNSINMRFNEKLLFLYSPKNPLNPAKQPDLDPDSGFIRVLDLGCAGGGFVKTLIDDGHLAVGLEGSDYSKRFRRAEWATCPGFLFTCDITKRFQLFLGDEPVKFDIITCWELIEHIAEQDLPELCRSVSAHLADGGLWIMSVANWHDVHNGVELHQTVRPKTWWAKTLLDHGFVEAPKVVEWFDGQWVRGREESELNFHIAVTNNPSKMPRIPQPRMSTRMLDRWIGSRPQKLLKKFVTGDS